jgi:hypothetical protein
MKMKAYQSETGYSVYNSDGSRFKRFEHVHNPDIIAWMDFFKSNGLELISIIRNEEYDYFEIIVIKRFEITEYITRPVEFFNLIKEDEDFPSIKFEEFLRQFVSIHTSALKLENNYKAELINKQFKNVGWFTEGFKPK